MKNQEQYIRVTFRIIGDDFIPEDITATLNLQPDKSHKIGEQLKTTTPSPRFHVDSRWLLRSKADPQDDLIIHFEDLLKRLMPQKEAIERFSQKYTIEFFCSISDISESHFVHLSNEVISKIASLGASIHMTTYPSG